MAGCGHRRFDELKPEAQVRYLQAKVAELEKSGMVLSIELSERNDKITELREIIDGQSDIMIGHQKMKAGLEKELYDDQELRYSVAKKLENFDWVLLQMPVKLWVLIVLRFIDIISKMKSLKRQLIV